MVLGQKAVDLLGDGAKLQEAATGGYFQGVSLALFLVGTLDLLGHQDVRSPFLPPTFFCLNLPPP